MIVNNFALTHDFIRHWVRDTSKYMYDVVGGAYSIAYGFEIYLQ